MQQRQRFLGLAWREEPRWQLRSKITRQRTQTWKQRNSATSARRWHEKGPEHTYRRNRRRDWCIRAGFLEGRKTVFEHNEYLRKQLLFIISSFFQWPIRNIPETILWCSIILLALFTRFQYHKRIAAYQSPSPEDTRTNFMMRDPTFCMLPYHWMIFFGVMLIVYCINGWYSKTYTTTFVQESRNFHLRDTRNTRTFVSAKIQ